jgi:hypothetical protein
VQGGSQNWMTSTAGVGCCGPRLYTLEAAMLKGTPIPNMLRQGMTAAVQDREA